MKKIIVLSDLWGISEGSYLDKYTVRLSTSFEIQCLDIRLLANIPASLTTEESIHHYFVEFGIDEAVQKLNILNLNSDLLIGFSLGGTIAWKACLEGLITQKLIAISSTRLRHETKKPEIEIELYYGEKDLFKPENEWFEAMQLSTQLEMNVGHLLFENEDFIASFCKRINLNS